MKRNIIKIIFSSLIVLFTIASCKDMWDDHYYNTDNMNKSELNLYEYMKTQTELSTFCEMCLITGYDTILSKSNTYTVWAPVNSALTSVDLKDTVAVTEIVKNHISMFSYPTSGIISKEIYMLDKKFINFQQSGSGYTFGGYDIELDKSNVAASNGILHLLNGYAPYASNIWEFIGKTKGLDSLRAYLYSQSVYEFDPKSSIEIGTNDKGQSVYDSIIIFSNPILSKIGALNAEDSTYTAILPNNAAWIKAYNLIKNKYVTLGADGQAKQRLNTQFAIVKDLIFKENVSDPSGLDSITSTIGTVFKNPLYLFENSTKNSLSNGFAYVTDSLRFKAEDSYQQSIKIEAENSSYGRSSLYANLYIRSSLGSSLNPEVSDNKYLLVEPATVSSATQNSATFPIPNTLSGKYNVYCVFLPSSIINPTDTKAYKFKFYISFLSSGGTQITDATINSAHAIVAKQGSLSATFSSQPQVITKFYVTQINFPYCNLFNKGDATSIITTSLKVENASKITESVIYDRSLRVDYIILEPAQ